MHKWIVFILIFAGVVLYFMGALDFDMSSDKIDVSIDKNKAKEIGESIRDKIEE